MINDIIKFYIRPSETEWTKKEEQFIQMEFHPKNNWWLVEVDNWCLIFVKFNCVGLISVGLSMDIKWKHQKRCLMLLMRHEKDKYQSKNFLKTGTICSIHITLPLRFNVFPSIFSALFKKFISDVVLCSLNAGLILAACGKLESYLSHCQNGS